MLECICPKAGFCKQFNRQMTPHLRHLCKTREDFRELFAKQAGIVQETLTVSAPIRNQHDDLVTYIRSLGVQLQGFDPAAPVGNYCLLQNADELASLLEHLVKVSDEETLEYYLEIGVGAAGLLRLICETLPIEHAFYIDQHEDRYRTARNRNIEAILQPVDAFEGRSESPECIDWLRSQPTMDLICVDADHSYTGVRHDTLLSLPSLRHGGRIFFHDSACHDWPGVSRWVKEIQQTGVGGLELEAHFATKFGLTVFRKR